MQVQDKACHRPRRSRRAALFGLVSVEVLTLGCILTRMYSRWKTAPGRQVDDYLVFIVFVSLSHLHCRFRTTSSWFK